MTPDQPLGPSAPASPNPTPQQPLRRRRARLLVLIAGLALLATAALVILPGPDRESEIRVGNKVHTIQLDVLNGVGEAKLAQRMTDYLRSRGFDVVEIGNYREELERTLVIDRTGNAQAALQVAEALGVPREQVIQRVDKSLYLDVSVFIGKDYSTLQPFQ